MSDSRYNAYDYYASRHINSAIFLDECSQLWTAQRQLHGVKIVHDKKHNPAPEDRVLVSWHGWSWIDFWVSVSAELSLLGASSNAESLRVVSEIPFWKMRSAASGTLVHGRPSIETDFHNIDIIEFASCRTAYQIKAHQLGHITRVSHLQSAWTLEERSRLRIRINSFSVTPVNSCQHVVHKHPRALPFRTGLPLTPAYAIWSCG